jgi:hypothetical protein
VRLHTKNAPFGLLLAVGALVAACHSAGPYGHAREYVVLDEETKALSGSREYDPVMAQRQAEEWRKGKIVLFGVVQSRSPGAGGRARLKLSVKALAPRNLCDNKDDDESCRVTVSSKDFGVVSVLVSLTAQDDVGPHSVAPKSLLRVVGTIGQDVSESDGAPVVRAEWYRHWPPFFYVTLASARDMLQ